MKNVWQPVVIAVQTSTPLSQKPRLWGSLKTTERWEIDGPVAPGSYACVVVLVAFATISNVYPNERAKELGAAAFDVTLQDDQPQKFSQNGDLVARRLVCVFKQFVHTIDNLPILNELFCIIEERRSTIVQTTCRQLF
jgi:hypothetical protein